MEDLFECENCGAELTDDEVVLGQDGLILCEECDEDLNDDMPSELNSSY